MPKSPAYEFDTIFTLEARSNCMLEVVTKHFDLGEGRVFNEIQSAITQLRMILTAKGVQYPDLQKALIPNRKSVEYAFVFDWSKFGAVPSYGREVMNIMLPLLAKGSSRSVLVGDWNSKKRFADIFRESFGDSSNASLLNEPRRLDTLYFVYLNNLTEASAARLDAALSKHAAYLGSIDLTYPSLLKAFLSTMLARAFIQHKRTIIQSHEDDRDNTEDANIVGYDFEKHGYINRSVPMWLYGLFLSYKIERPVLPNDDSDTRFSLNAMTATPQPMPQCIVELDERKIEYLQRNKADSLHNADFNILSAAEIASQIQIKLTGNYIYNLSRSKNGETLKFNIIIENGKTVRNLCVLKYRPADQKLCVITFY